MEENADITKRYQEKQWIGSGGTATVYKCIDTQLNNTPVAIKQLKKSLAADPEMRQTLIQEIMISRQLRHPNIVGIHDLYLDHDEIGAVMDLIEGMALSDWIKINREQRLATIQDRFDFLITVMDALACAHQIIVHRDLKPANIMLQNGDILHPIIMDFGFALPSEELKEGQVVGTPRYIAPEQYLVLPTLDHRADIFSMGVLAYELFTGERTPVSMSKEDYLTGKEPRPVSLGSIAPPSAFCPAIPPALDHLILKMSAFDPVDRPQTATEIVTALRQITLLKEGFDTTGSSKKTDQHIVTIPAGSVTLGSSPTYKNRCEKPRRRVRLSSFYMDSYPVTNQDYRKFLQQTGYAHPPLLNDPILGKDTHPVIAVTWQDAHNYAQWAGGSLPSEAQWEYAAKGETANTYPWGDDPPSPTLANIDGLEEATLPVGSFNSGQSPFLVHDMCGNVWEWCQDVWSENFYRSLEKDTLDPINLADGDEYSLRGGAYDSFSSMGRCAFRFHAKPDQRLACIGFRVIYPLT